MALLIYVHFKNIISLKNYKLTLFPPRHSLRSLQRRNQFIKKKKEEKKEGKQSEKEKGNSDKLALPRSPFCSRYVSVCSFFLTIHPSFKGY